MIGYITRSWKRYCTSTLLHVQCIQAHAFITPQEGNTCLYINGLNLNSLHVVHVCIPICSPQLEGARSHHIPSVHYLERQVKTIMDSRVERTEDGMHCGRFHLCTCVCQCVCLLPSQELQCTYLYVVCLCLKSKIYNALSR